MTGFSVICLLVLILSSSRQSVHDYYDEVNNQQHQPRSQLSTSSRFLHHPMSTSLSNCNSDIHITAVEHGETMQWRKGLVKVIIQSMSIHLGIFLFFFFRQITRHTDQYHGKGVYLSSRPTSGSLYIHESEVSTYAQTSVLMLS